MEKNYKLFATLEDDNGNAIMKIDSIGTIDSLVAKFNKEMDTQKKCEQYHAFVNAMESYFDSVGIKDIGKRRIARSSIFSAIANTLNGQPEIKEYRVFNIDWDVDCDEDEEDLPCSVLLHIDRSIVAQEDMPDEIDDLLYEEFGVEVLGYDYEIVND